MRAATCAALAASLLCGAAEARTLGLLTFKPCDLVSVRSVAFVAAECTHLSVPENPEDPEGRRLDLHIALVPALTREAQPDPVVMLAGGPGQAASEAYVAAAAAFAPLRRNRHVLLVDQRGTGKSNRLSCPMPDWKSPEPVDVERARAQALECRQTLSARADLRFYTTGDYLRDLEAVRAALGAPRFNLVGGSYGTRVALDYLRRHPEAIRSVFIDSVVPPELALGQDHAQNLEEALSKMSARCGADPACGERFGEPLRTLHVLADSLRGEARRVRYHHPATHAGTEAPLSGEAVSVVARLFAYAPQSLSLLPLLADEAARGRPQPLLAQAEMVFEWAEESLAHGMELSVVCTEDEPWLRPDPADAATLMGGDLVEYTRAQCAVWPRGKLPPDFKQPVKSDKPVLLLSGELDPVTPPRYADQVAKTLSNSRHLIAKGQGHTPMAEGCVPKLLEQFVDELKPQALDASCLEVLGPAPFFLDYSGPAP